MSKVSRRSFIKGALTLGMTGAASVALTACSSGTSNQKTADEGKITKVVVVTSGNGEPYSLIATDGTWTGIDHDIWEEIKKDTGIEYEVKQAEFSSMFGELDAGRANVVANCLATKKERVEKYLASHPYYGDAQCVAVAPDNTTINTFEDLKGKKCGVTTGQASETIARDMAGKYGFEITNYEVSDAGLKDLQLGRIDAMFTTDTVVAKFNDANNVQMRILDERTLTNNVAYFFAKTDEGQKYCDFVNEEIDKMLNDGRMASIVTKWLHSDMTKMIKKD